MVHAHERARGSADDDGVEIPLHACARSLFVKYDVNRNGLLEHDELSRLLKDVRLERFECSPALVARFVAHEFERLDTDGSGACTRIHTYTLRAPTNYTRTHACVHGTHRP